MAQANSDTITLTRGDLVALAEKLAGHDHCDMTKPALLNAMAATLLGPRHDWARIKNAQGPIRSQRAGGTPAPTTGIDALFPVKLISETGEMTRARVTASETEDIKIETEDGHTVWVELNDGRFKVHLYNNISDAPISLWSEPFKTPMIIASDFSNALYPSATGWANVEGEDTPIRLGYQVVDPDDGTHWGDRASYEILQRDDAEADLVAAHAAGQTRYRLVPVCNGDIEDPDFVL